MIPGRSLLSHAGGATRRRAFALLPATVAALALLVACGGSSSGTDTGGARRDEAPPLPSLTPTPRPVSPAPSPSPPASPSPAPVPPATPHPDGQAETRRATDAAASLLGARVLDTLTFDACLEDNPGLEMCIAFDGDVATAAAGIARFAAGDPQGGPFTLYMGRDAAGDWRFWFATTARTYILDTLPGMLLVCGRDRSPGVASEPRSERVVTVQTGDALAAAAFVLAAPGSFPAGVGEGWYAVTGTAQGWIDARDTTAATLGDCSLHDQVEGTARG